jgi:hypothetical protein
MKRDGKNNQAQVILDAINRKLNDYIYGNPLPVVVKKYNIENDTVDLQLAINLYDNEGEFLQNAILYEIPIIRFSSKTASFKIKIKEGDDGLLLCSSRGLANWFEKTLETGIIQNEDTTLRWGVQNSVFFPSLFKNKSAEVNILKNINDSMTEMKNTIDNVISTIDNLTSAMVQVGNVGQPAPFVGSTIALLNTNKSQLTLNKTNLNNLIIEAQKTYDN